MMANIAFEIWAIGSAVSLGWFIILGMEPNIKWFGIVLWPILFPILIILIILEALV